MSANLLAHTLVFDLDDTLFAEEQFVLSGFRAVGENLKSRYGVDGFEREATGLFRAGVRGKIFDVALERVGRIPSSQLVAELVTVYRGHTPRIELLPDARECLDWAERRYDLALLTDGYQAVQQKKIAALGIVNRFGCIVTTDSLGREFWKPHPAGFRHIMERFARPAEGFVYVADNPHKDFIAPRALGWKTVRIRRAGSEHFHYLGAADESADHELPSLAELRHLFRPSEVEI